MALLNVSFFSEILSKQVQMNVILPQRSLGLIGMKGQDKALDSYKTLYLLHGMSDDYTIWERRTSIERYAHEKGIAVVMADAGLSWYTDMKYGGNYFQFFSKELPCVCRDFFPKMSTLRKDNYIAGLSMGGYGALKIAMRCPESFSKAASLSGALDFKSFLKTSEYALPIVGSLKDDFDIKPSENDLYSISETLVKSRKDVPEIYMWCGTEDGLYCDNVKFKNHLDNLGIKATYSESSGGHSWDCWDREIQKVISWL